MKVNILVFGGSGKMGATVAWDLVEANDVGAVGLLGRGEDALERTKAWFNSPETGIQEQNYYGGHTCIRCAS